MDLDTYKVAVIDVKSEQLFETGALFKSFIIRTQNTLNGQTRGVRMFDDYKIVPKQAREARNISP